MVLQVLRMVLGLGLAILAAVGLGGTLGLPLIPRPEVFEPPIFSIARGALPYAPFLSALGLTAIAISEQWRVRQLLYWLLAGAVIAMLSFHALQSGGVSPAAMFAGTAPLKFVTAGAFGGFAYWLTAGRSAGALSALLAGNAPVGTLGAREEQRRCAMCAALWLVLGLAPLGLVGWQLFHNSTPSLTTRIVADAETEAAKMLAAAGHPELALKVQDHTGHVIGTVADAQKKDEAFGKAKDVLSPLVGLPGVVAVLQNDIIAKDDTDPRIAAENARIHAAAEEEARQKAEAEAKRKAEEEAARLASEADAKRKAEEEAAAKIEADRVARAKAEAARLAAEVEAARKAEQEARAKAEADRIAAEVEAKRKAEEDAARLAAEAEAKHKAEEAAKIEAERVAREQAEAARLAAEAEAKRKAQEEARAKAEAERIAAEADAMRKAAEEEARKKAEAERAAAEAEAKRKALEDEEIKKAEAQRLAAEVKRMAEEEQARQKAVAEQMAAEIDAKRKAREEAQIRAETKRTAEVEAENRAAAEARQKAASLAADAAAKRKAEEKAARTKAFAEPEAAAALPQAVASTSNAPAGSGQSAPAATTDYASCAVELESITRRRKIFFKSSSSELRRVHAKLLDMVAGLSKRCPDMIIVVSGHTDFSGNEQANQILSEERAEAVRAALVERGVDSKHLDVRAFAWRQPSDGVLKRRSRAADRRAEFTPSQRDLNDHALP